jgi:hypothetical protein
MKPVSAKPYSFTQYDTYLTQCLIWSSACMVQSAAIDRGPFLSVSPLYEVEEMLPWLPRTETRSVPTEMTCKWGHAPKFTNQTWCQSTIMHDQSVTSLHKPWLTPDSPLNMLNIDWIKATSQAMTIRPAARQKIEARKA